MRIEFLGSWKHNNGVQYEAGDVKSFSEKEGDFFCQAGIGKDLDGNVETAEPSKTKRVLLEVENTSIASQVEKA